MSEEFVLSKLSDRHANATEAGVHGPWFQSRNSMDAESSYNFIPRFSQSFGSDQ